jgi:ATP-dependent RNA helicase RhlE
VPKPPADRDPEEFLDDDIDNFGNRADYVSPYQGKNQGRNRRPGGGAGQGQVAVNAANGGQGQARSGGQQRSGGSGGRGEKRPARANNGGGARRDGGGRGRPARDDAAWQEPAVRNPTPARQPVIIRKESKLDRYPTPEQLDDLPSRPRGERPALLTRKVEPGVA